MTNNLIIRFAEKSDTPIIFSLIRQLAEYEKLSDKVITTEEKIKQSIFGNDQFIEVLIAEFEGKAVGYALFFKNYSTFLGKAGIYLEDLFVLPDYRGKGIGKSLLKKIISIAKQRDYGRVEWSVLDWNVSAIEIYKKIGAEPLDEWKIFRLTSDKF
ncbi:MAG: GNAT family N-acetyltransferase [Ignavibacteriota bacterium]|nr:GNAT family N-acetyltransferase [Ignavibacteriota bacterium]MBW7842334.1 GNAT family N-acetyltransferase [Ignavibacterium sp.]MCO6447006.1 GNAT family N-acetyltransferase [Ignavibacterium album]MCZ2268884.1 GNAT family N-acetyltransferase [Ignavibacteriales bacterium]HOJ07689.1 GNAT family N-acetyltransferase [Ignavibacteriaceae bacterium]